MNNPAQVSDPRLAAYASNGALQTRLDEAWRALQRELPGLVAWIESEQVSEADAGDAVISATLRVLRNPEGAKKRDGSIDDWSESVELADSTEDMYFTSAELRRLSPAVYGAGSFTYTGSGCY